MLPALLKYASVFAIGMFKFVAAPIAGVAAGLPMPVVWALSVAGMMTTVILISGVGQVWALHLRRRRQLKGKPLFSRRSRTVVRIYRRFGMVGIAFLTPILFSPVGGTVIATQLHVPRWRILVHMTWSAVLWGFAFTLLAIKFSHLPIFDHYR
ncbi:hypothetical protein [Hymenobacter rubripertinctus]|uniref:Small multi-drug export protein n=1 Tax=Hymenobacter rubripertinctus TaxID=2029981 RepID=A0A418QYK4_9BACT|nr:hypothetical protein [Hymenobacter rubripertinctus]RIY10266.1 hypothetical protein D0T11_10460 [Hymenobacter rubripertinctus]